MLCDCSHISLYYSRNKTKIKRKFKSRKIDKKKRKSKENIGAQVYHNIAYICQVLIYFGIQNVFPVSILLMVKYKLSISHFLKTEVEK